MDRLRNSCAIRRAVTVVLCIVFMFVYLCTDCTTFVSCAATSGKIVYTGTYDYDKAYAVLDILNEQREKNGLPRLTMDKELLKGAMRRAAETSIYFSHYRPDGTPFYTVTNKLQRGFSGENIAAGQNTAAAVMEAWTNSDDHRVNMMNEKYVSVGIGCYKKDGIVYWAQSFSSQPAKTVVRTGRKKVTLTTRVSADKLQKSDFQVKTTKNTVKVGKNRHIQIYLKNEGWPLVKIRIDPASFNWKSGNRKIATVSKTGVVTGKKAGKVTIVAKLKTYPYTKLVYTIKVKK